MHTQRHPDRLRERVIIMRTVSIFRNGRNQAIRLPRDMEFEGISTLEIIREGDTLVLRPVRPGWLSFADEPGSAGEDFMLERPDITEDEGRFDP